MFNLVLRFPESARHLVECMAMTDMTWQAVQLLRPKSIQVFVRNLQGKTVTVDIKAGDTVESVKAAIETKERVPKHLQRLILEGK